MMSDKAEGKSPGPVIGSSKRKRKSTIVKRSVGVSPSEAPNKSQPKIDKDEEVGKDDQCCGKTNAKVEDKNDNTDSSDGSKKSKRRTGNKEEEMFSVSTDEDSEELRRKLRDCDENPSHKCKSCSLCYDHMSLKQLKEELKTEIKTKSRFDCLVCFNQGKRRTYGTLERLEQHMKVSHKEEPMPKKFECKQCDKPAWFTTKSKLSYHMNSKHPGVLQFVCEICTETFKLKANYKNHIQTHNIVVPKKFSCDVCSGTFVNKAGFLLHKKRFPGPHIKQSCEHCGFSFSKESLIKNHRCKKLLLQEAEKARELAQSKETNPKLSQTNTQTEECDRVEVDTYQVVETSEEHIPTTTSEKSPETITYYKQASTETEQTVQLEPRVLLTSEEPLFYRPVQVQTQTLQDSVLLQEFREISDKNDIITSEGDQTIIIRDLNVASSHIFQAVDITDVDPNNDNHTSQVVHLNLSDLNVVGPYTVIKEKSQFS